MNENSNDAFLQESEAVLRNAAMEYMKNVIEELGGSEGKNHEI